MKSGLALAAVLAAALGTFEGLAPPGAAPDDEWVQALPPRQGDWPRWCSLVVGFDGKLWAFETAKAQKMAFASADGLRWSRTAVQAAWGERYRPAFAFFQGRMWLLGGRTGTVENPTYHNDVWVSQDGTNWRLATQNAGWTPRWDHTALVFDGKLWVIGGFGAVAPNAADIWFTSDGVHWTRAAEKAPWSRWKYRSFVVHRDRIWAVGFQAGNDVWSTRDGVHWEQATADAGWPAAIRSKHAIIFQGRIWVLGGSDLKGDFQNDVWVSSDGAHWEQRTPHAPWHPRQANYSVVFQNKLWIFGGKNAPDDVWYLARRK
jgi:hypothetical protein